MLVNLTPNNKEIERRKIIAKENGFEYIPQSNKIWLIENGIYQDSVSFNFAYEEFIEELDGYKYNEKIYEINKRKNETILHYYICNIKFNKYLL